MCLKLCLKHFKVLQFVLKALPPFQLMSILQPQALSKVFRPMLDLYEYGKPN